MRRLLRSGFLFVLVSLTTLAVASCSGSANTGGTPEEGDDGVWSTGSARSSRDASAEAADATPSDAAADASGPCTASIHVPIGGTLSGSTCGGPVIPQTHNVCDTDAPVSYFYVDAPAGVAVGFTSTKPLLVFGFDSCSDWALECGVLTNASTFTTRLFGVELEHTCGDFTITVVK